jgi:hypothetical protein
MIAGTLDTFGTAAVPYGSESHTRRARLQPCRSRGGLQ